VIDATTKGIELEANREGKCQLWFFLNDLTLMGIK
jgi:hypothetical protein